MTNDIIYNTENYVFSFRVGGVLIHNGKILLQSIPGDEGYVLPGGHVSLGETTDAALIREFKEELHADVSIERLLIFGENFLKWNSKPCHQICVFYLISLMDFSQIPLEGSFHPYDEAGNMRFDIEFCWISLSDLTKKTLYPIEIKQTVLSLPDHIVSFVHKTP